MIYAIILAGGIGSRMNMPGDPKQYLVVKDKPIIMYSIEAFQHTEEIDKIIVVAAEKWKPSIKEWMNVYSISKFADVAEPGKNRQESIFSGLKKCIAMSQSEDDLVIVHDAVRPLITSELIRNCIDALEDNDACMPIIPVKDTIYCSSDGNHISGLLDRNILYAGQTPEGFKLKKYYDINTNASEEERSLTRGSSEIAYKKGMNVKLIPGDENNFKITTGFDYHRFIQIFGDN